MGFGIVEVLRIVASAIQGVGVALICWYSAEALAVLVTHHRATEEVRHDFARRLLVALEFFIAGELIRLTVAQDIQDLMLLGGIVIIRAVLGYTVHTEAATGKARKLPK